MTGCSAGVFGGLEIITVLLYQYLQDTRNQPKTLFWACVSGAILSSAVALSIENINLRYDWSDWLLIMGHCATYVFLMSFLMYGSALVPSLVPIIGSTSTVYVVIAQYTFLSKIHPGNRNGMELLVG